MPTHFCCYWQQMANILSLLINFRSEHWIHGIRTSQLSQIRFLRTASEKEFGLLEAKRSKQALQINFTSSSPWSFLLWTRQVYHLAMRLAISHILTGSTFLWSSYSLSFIVSLLCRNQWHVTYPSALFPISFLWQLLNRFYYPRLTRKERRSRRKFCNFLEVTHIVQGRGRFQVSSSLYLLQLPCQEWLLTSCFATDIICLICNYTKGFF